MMVTVNEGNQAWEYDQVNIICPVSKEGEEEEEHIIYSVEKEEFEHCRVTSARPRIVAICNRPAPSCTSLSPSDPSPPHLEAWSSDLDRTTTSSPRPASSTSTGGSAATAPPTT